MLELSDRGPSWDVPSEECRDECWPSGTHSACAGGPRYPRRSAVVDATWFAAHSAGWALLPLRAFSASPFCFAGLQKLANPRSLTLPIRHRSRHRWPARAA